MNALGYTAARLLPRAPPSGGSRNIAKEYVNFMTHPYRMLFFPIKDKQPSTSFRFKIFRKAKTPSSENADG
jgi:hypothetical protein